MHRKLYLLVFVSILLTGSLHQPVWGKSAAPYITKGDCDGFPKVDLKTALNFCVGLVASQLGFVRGVAAIGSDLYVTDLGGWNKGRGRLLRLGHYGRDRPEVLLTHLDEPNSIIPAPGNTLYIGVLGKIMQYDPGTHTSKDIVVNLPMTGLHPISAFAAAPDGSLYINIGAATDHCEKADDSPPDPKTPCPETISHILPRGSIIQVMPGTASVDATTISPYATGLRNSMALVVLPSGDLYAAVNARDAINQADASLSDEELPHDTFDKIEQGGDYGWPYCFDNNLPSPEYPHYDCSTKKMPTLLLPAHSAPLGMLVYKGKLLQALKGHLVIGYHGYRAKGHRIVALTLDKAGMPKSAPVEIVADWDLKPGNHPQGAPVSLFEMEDGSIFITEDHNGTLLRLSENK